MQDGQNRGPFLLRSPCVVDVETDAGLLSLMMDKEYPNYLFVSIDGELRKCVELSKKPPYPIENDEDVIDFLHSLEHSSIVQTIIEQETELDEGWEEL